jgi:hypothetical protein
MSIRVTLTLDDETGAYLERIAADQRRTPAEVAAWIVTEDLRRERGIDADLLGRLDDMVADARQPVAGPLKVDEAPRRERTGA